MDLYAENILDHYRHPRGKVSIETPTVEHEEANLACGDVLKLQIRIPHGTIEECGWSGNGCAISQASMSMLTEELAGASLKDAEQISVQDIYDLLGVPIGPRRVKCALLCLHTLKNAVRKAQGHPPQGWLETIAPPYTSLTLHL